MRNWIEKHPKTIFTAIFIVMYMIGDRILNDYYLPDAKGIQNSYYSHGLRKNYSGTVKWGSETNRIYTNSLGFKDEKIRDVEKKTDRYRILFIGDSFTEGSGLPFDQTFVGKFSKSMQSHNSEILNAGVVSYSPKVYLYRLKHLIEEERLEFNELFVFIDISDIHDEISYSAWTPVEETWPRKMDAYVRSISFTYKLLRDNILNTQKLGVLKEVIEYAERQESKPKVSTELSMKKKIGKMAKVAQ